MRLKVKVVKSAETNDYVKEGVKREGKTTLSDQAFQQQYWGLSDLFCCLSSRYALKECRIRSHRLELSNL